MARKEEKPTYKPKVALVRLHTGGKDVEDYRKRLTGQGYTRRQFEFMKAADEYFDGLTLWVSMWNWDNHESWHLWNWRPEDDTRVMAALYAAEQFHPVPRYKNDFEGFKKDWASGEYDPGCTYTFPLDAVEVLEVVQEEENNIDPQEVKRAVKKAQDTAYRQRAKNRATKKKYRFKKRVRR